ncbi:MAG: TonB family protein [Brevundimonas sp.]|nr:TonB family protein [Brevundimonas sp.]
MKVLGIPIGVALAALAGCATPSPRGSPEHGQVQVSCLVNRDGTLSDCRVEREEPAGAGFGEAALRAASQTRVTRLLAEQNAGQRIFWTTRGDPPRDSPQEPD